MHTLQFPQPTCSDYNMSFIHQSVSTINTPEYLVLLKFASEFLANLEKDLFVTTCIVNSVASSNLEI